MVTLWKGVAVPLVWAKNNRIVPASIDTDFARNAMSSVDSVSLLLAQMKAKEEVPPIIVGDQ